jgi:hypothetical protein
VHHTQQRERDSDVDLSGHDCTKQWARAPLFLRRGGVDSSSPQRCPTNLWSISRLQNRMQKLPLSPIPGAWAKTRGDTPSRQRADTRRGAAPRRPHHFQAPPPSGSHTAIKRARTTPRRPQHSLADRTRTTRQRPISGIVILLARLPIGARSWGS